jgi:hypothetical protein
MLSGTYEDSWEKRRGSLRLVAVFLEGIEFRARRSVLCVG